LAGGRRISPEAGLGLDVLVELERLLVVLLGELEPDEQPARTMSGMTRMAPSVMPSATATVLRAFMAVPPFESAGGGWCARRSDGALAIMSLMSSRVNSMS
jgi:hypothetical protein